MDDFLSAGVFGKHCELNSYGFEELSYMEFPSLDPNNNYIYMKFATLKDNALLMYNHDNQTGDKAEFLALEIVEGRVRFSFNLGSGTYKLMTGIRVSDGHFHTVIARRAGMVSLKGRACSCRAVKRMSRVCLEKRMWVTSVLLSACLFSSRRELEQMVKSYVFSPVKRAEVKGAFV